VTLEQVGRVALAETSRQLNITHSRRQLTSRQRSQERVPTVPYNALTALSGFKVVELPRNVFASIVRMFVNVKYDQIIVGLQLSSLMQPNSIADPIVGAGRQSGHLV